MIFRANGPAICQTARPLALIAYLLIVLLGLQRLQPRLGKRLDLRPVKSRPIATKWRCPIKTGGYAKTAHNTGRAIKKREEPCFEKLPIRVSCFDSFSAATESFFVSSVTSCSNVRSVQNWEVIVTGFFAKPTFAIGNAERFGSLYWPSLHSRAPSPQRFPNSRQSHARNPGSSPNCGFKNLDSRSNTW